MNARQIISNLLKHPYPHDLMRIRAQVVDDFAGDEARAKAELEVYCTEDYALGCRQAWQHAQTGARAYLETFESKSNAALELVHAPMQGHVYENHVTMQECAADDFLAWYQHFQNHDLSGSKVREFDIESVIQIMAEWLKSPFSLELPKASTVNPVSQVNPVQAVTETFESPRDTRDDHQPWTEPDRSGSGGHTTEEIRWAAGEVW